MKKAKILGICLLMTFTGCERREVANALSFVENKEIEYSDSYSYCSLIDSINGKQIRDKDKKTNSFVFEENDVFCNTKKVQHTLGNQKILYTYKNIDYEITVTIIDTTAPIFDEIEKEYVVEKDNKYFSLEKEISYSDNYSTKDKIQLSFNGTYDLSATGEYAIQVILTDENKNIAEKDVLIKVVDSLEEYKNKKTEEVKEHSSEPVKQTQQAPQTPQQEINNGGGNVAPQVPEQPTQKPYMRFSIDNYNSFDEVLNACTNYIRGSNAMCVPYKENGINKGYETSQ